ncbi:TPA: ABC transporter substrate-binding protein, partial [Klebsiella pneumoniae]|nr:ABC transporter substrate-binding protein [Klebsiella pneumoniae]HBU0029420.1 ABC transporter substrate-binding protein [Klebsiella pneumoniae]
MKNKLWLLLSMSALQLSPLLISTAQADLLDDIKQKKEIVIATEAR